MATYELVVIGSGPAGQSAAELAAFLGHSALIVEQGQPGGAVTTTGGAPTKTLREVALALSRGYLGEELGHAPTRPTMADALAVARRRTRAVSRSLQAATARRIENGGVAYWRGTARITSPRTLTVTREDGSRQDVTGSAIVLATGSRPARLPGVPFEDPAVYDSNRIFTLQQLPNDIVIVGGGPVGVEFATIFANLGVSVTLVDGADRLLPAMDGELAGVVMREFAANGVALALGTRVTEVSRRDGRLTIALSNGAVVQTDAVLMAAGRVANTDGLGLETAGVQLDQRGRVVVDRYFQTTCPGIYAVGDAAGPSLASLATQQGRAATCHAFGLAFGVPVDRTPSFAVYAMPELAGVGLTEEQVRTTATAYVVGRCDLSQTARGAIAGRGGRLKLIVAADDRRLLGVHCVGDIASELVAMGHAVLHAGGSIDIFLTLALNTPTYSAAYRDAAIDAMSQLAALARRPVPQIVGAAS
jgi:NAD(P) transhydrogenase